MRNKVMTALLAACALGITACKSAQVREQEKPCQIRWHDYDTGRRGATELMPKAKAVKRIKSIKPLPGFGKPQTDHWVYCK